MLSAAFPVRLSSQLLTAIGGPGRRIPDIRRLADLQLLERLTAAYPAAGAADGWRLRFGRELNATEDRKHFGPSGLPVIEGKHLGPFTVNVSACTARVPAGVARDLLPDERFTPAAPRLPRRLWRDQPTLTHRRRPPGRRRHHAHRLLPAHSASGTTSSISSAAFSTRMSSMRIGRLLMGGHVTTSLVEQLPLPLWRDSAIQRRIARLAERLSRRGLTDRDDGVAAGSSGATVWN